MVTAGITITRQVVYGGFVNGLSIGLLALGVVLIYRSSRVINFAVGALGAFSAALLALLVVQYHWNFWPSALVAVVAGGAFAAAIEASVITRLFRAPRVIVLVATIGIAGLAQAAQTSLPKLGRRQPADPLSDGADRHLASRRPDGARLGAGGPDHRAAAGTRVDLVPDPHRHGQGGPGRSGQPGAGPAVGHQPEDCCRRWCGRSPDACRRCRSSCWPAHRAASPG